MPKVSNTIIYPQDDNLSMDDYTIGTNSNTGNKKTQTYAFKSIFSLFYNFLGYNAFFNTTDTTTYPIGTPGCFYVFDENDVLTTDFSEARKITFSSYDTYNFDTANYFNIIVSSGKFLFKLINLEDKNNFVFLSPSNFVLSGTGTTFNVDVLAEAGLSNGSFVNYKRYLLVLEFAAGTFNPADYDLTDFTNTSSDPFVTAQDLTDALSLLPTPIINHSELTLNDGTNPHGTTKQDVGLGDVPNLNTTDAVNKAHEHTNFSVLNGTEESFTTALKNAYNSAVSWITTNGINLINHLTNYSNPHSVTKSQVGLGSVDNTSDADKPISNATQVALNSKADLVDGKVPVEQLPDVIDISGKQDKIIVVSASGTASNDQKYHVVSNATFTDPGSPVEGKGYEVFVRNGIATIGGVDYPVGSYVFRTYHSGVWGSQLIGAAWDLSDLTKYSIYAWTPMPASWVGYTPTIVGTADNASPIFTGTQVQKSTRRRYVSASTAGSSVDFYEGSFRQTCMGCGFFFNIKFAFEDAVTVVNARSFAGLFSSLAVFGNVNPSTQTNIFGVGADSGDTNLQLIHNDATGTATKVDLGANFPANTSAIDEYLFQCYNLQGQTGSMWWRLTNVTSMISTDWAEVTTDLPVSTSGAYINPRLWRNNGSTALAVRLSIMDMNLYKLL